MAFQFTADDIGFEVNPIKVDSTEKVCVDHFYLPKCLPTPIFEDNCELYYASDQAENTELVHSLLPSYHTPNHCVIIPESHIPTPISFRSVDTTDESTIQHELESIREKLQNLRETLKKVKQTNDQERIQEIEDAISNCQDIIIQSHLAILSDNASRINPTAENPIYIKEVTQMISYLESLNSSDKVVVPPNKLYDDIDELSQKLDDYQDNVCHETELQLKKTYHSILSMYNS